MSMVYTFLNKHPLLIICLGFLFIGGVATLINYTFFKGIKVGITQGKVRSIEKVPAGGGKYSVHKIDMANVITEDGETIKVYCISYCTLDLKVEVNIYKSLFSKKLNYVYDRN